MDKLISIIVPVYNTDSSLLQKCVNSLVSQTYKNIEIILVDDGSKRPTADLCEDFGISDVRIRVIHKQNGGLSSARNAGLEVASGSLISFVDSDDYLHPKAIENMYRARCISNTPIVCMQSIIISASGKILHRFGNDSGNIEIVNWRSYISGICHKRLSESVCDKLFEAYLFKNIRFESGRLNEDFLFLSKMLLDKIDVATIDFAGYHYLKHDGTITAHNSDMTSLKDAVKNSSELAEIAKTKFPEVFLSFVYSTLFQAKVLLTLLPTESIGSVEWVVNTNIVKQYFHLINKCGLKPVDRMLLLGFITFPKLTKSIYGFLK